MLDRIEFVLGEAFVALRRNGWMTFAAVTTAAMALFLLASLALTYFGLSQVAEQAGKRLTVRVFLRDGHSQDAASVLRDRILAIRGVAAVRYVPKDIGLEEFQRQNPGIDVTGLREQNPLPDCFHVSIKDQESFESVVKQLQALPDVEPDGVKYPSDVQEFVRDVRRLVPMVGLTLGIVMLATSGILIYNAIRMTVMARRREVGIMLLVGARRPMVWAPMVLEGLVQGLLGGLFAGLVLLALHSVVNGLLASRMGPQFAIPVLPAGPVFAVLGLVGAAYGVMCSLIAVREPWKAGGVA
jgi:cell division transport system permease protein